MATDNTAQGPPYSLLVRVSETSLGIEKKLQKYFQNTSKSGGGKCKVRVGPTSGSFWIDFNRKQAKDAVIAKRNHSVAVSDTLHVKVFLETKEEKEEKVPEETKSNILEIKHISSRTVAISKELPDERHPDEVRALIPSNFFLQKIFLHVEAQLTFKLSRDQKEIIFTLCPDIKIEGGHDGPERVIGEFEDIEKIYRYLSDTMLGHDRKEDYSYSASASEIEEPMPNECNSLVLYSNPKRADEDLDLLSVPAHLYEYFKYFFAETLDRIEVEHEVRIKSALVYPSGNVSLDFETNRMWDKEAAKEAFTRTFQREIQNMTQKDVSVSENKLVLDMQKTLSDMFQNLHIKADDKDLVLWGDQKEVYEAQKFIEQNYNKKSGEAAASAKKNTGIEVDTAHWRVLGQEIREIEKTYFTVMELVHKPKTKKTLILFKPKDKDLDLSAHAYEDFNDIFQMLLPQIVTEVAILKPIDLKRKCWLEKTFFENLEKKHPHVIVEWNERELTLTGLPKYIEKAMKYVKKYFTVQSPVQKKEEQSPVQQKEEQNAVQQKEEQSAVQQKEEPALSLAEN
ncbi:E3 ubiquitin-protein ligase DTX3L-like [Notamacropus eugenii]|uniref:E3 ubiquitin-protein ligase DTX3L-like n=1 Tax=Notamacropus eugenii TaxID=9315 RepID=UPI003B6780BF